MSSGSAQTTNNTLLARAQHWCNALPAQSDAIEQARRLPAELATQMAADGLFHMLVPRDYGGLEVHPSEFARTLTLIARGDGAAGWNVMIGATTGLLSASMPAAEARHIFGDKPGVLTVGVTAPLGRAERVDGGYCVTGRWPFGSGSDNADWICGGCMITEGGETVIGDHGAPESRLLMFAADQVEREDTWHVSGLKGTGSNHFNVDNQFVPAERAIILGGKPNITRPLYKFPMLGLLAIGVASVSIGIGYKALDAFKTMAGGKTPQGASRTLAERGSIQQDVALAQADLKSSEAYIHRAIDEAWQLATDGAKLSAEVRANLRLAAVNATERATLAVDRLYRAGGGSSIYDSNELQRCFRDIHVTTQHIMVGQPVYEVVGRVALGLDARQML